MLNQYSAKQRKRLELYFRCISASCSGSILGKYYVAYEFGLSDLLFRKGVIKGALKQWSITNAEELKTRIRWLLDDGYRKEYKSMHARLAALTETSRGTYLETSRNREEFAKMEVVNTCLHQLPSGDITAYGGAWAVYLSRIGLSKGLITKKEAWDYKIEAAQMLQECYSSWREFFVAYLSGSHYSASKPGIGKYIYSTSMNDLMGKSSLLYKKAAWGQNLLPESV